MRGKALLLLLVFSFHPACALIHTEDVQFTRSDLIHVFQQWREAERRRSLELAEEVLKFESRSDRSFLENEFQLLGSRPSGPVVTDMEIHLVGHPADRGPGDYLFLEPLGRTYVTSRARIANRGGRPVIVYERLGATVDEQSRLTPEALQRTVLERQIQYWKSLDGDDLEEQVDRLLTTLRYRESATSYARDHDLDLAPFSPEPGTLLAEYSRLTVTEIRDSVVLSLNSSLIQTPQK